MSKYAKAKNCRCETDLMVKIGLSTACLPCIKLRHKEAVK